MNIKCSVCENDFRSNKEELVHQGYFDKPNKPCVGFGVETILPAKDGDSDIEIQFSVNLKGGNICPACALAALNLFLKQNAKIISAKACAGAGYGEWYDTKQEEDI